MGAPPLAKGRATSATARVEVHRDAAAVLADWANLETEAPCSIYQTRAWLLPWIETLGRKAGVRPMFVLVRAGDGTALALFCLGITRRGPFNVATFLGGKDSNFNLALIRPGGSWTPNTVRGLLHKAARSLGRDGPDVFVLANQPLQWGEAQNPLALLAHQPSPSAAYGTTLPAQSEQLFAAKLSKETRKKLRKKEAKLASLGVVTHEIATTIEQRREILGAFLAQKVARFETKGIVSEFETPDMRAFLEAASLPAGRGIELHALRAGPRIVATYGGAAHGGQWSGMFNSFDSDEEVARSSPGDLLLLRILAKACVDGLARFDLGIGEARYKAALCDEAISLFDCVVPINLAGRAYAAYARARQSTKRFVKARPRLMAAVSRLRSGSRALRSGRQP